MEESRSEQFQERTEIDKEEQRKQRVAQLEEKKEGFTREYERMKDQHLRLEQKRTSLKAALAQTEQQEREQQKEERKRLEAKDQLETQYHIDREEFKKRSDTLQSEIETIRNQKEAKAIELMSMRLYQLGLKRQTREDIALLENSLVLKEKELKKVEREWHQQEETHWISLKRFEEKSLPQAGEEKFSIQKELKEVETALADRFAIDNVRSKISSIEGEQEELRMAHFSETPERIKEREDFQEAIQLLKEDGREDILTLLDIDDWVDDYERRLNQIAACQEQYEGNPPKEKLLGVIKMGFMTSGKTFHKLLRGALRLESYFIETSSTQKMRELLSRRKDHLIKLMEDSGAVLTIPKILERPSVDAESSGSAEKELRTNPEVRKKVLEADKNYEGGFVVDVINIGFQSEETYKGKKTVSRRSPAVVIFNPGEWR